jgi:predicted nucleic acid-binding protein
MMLVDTSVWIDYFRGERSAAALAIRLDLDEVLIHPWVVGELALGHLGRRRNAIIEDLQRLPQAPIITDREVLQMVRARRLAGSGIGWVDAQLLASALVAGVQLWTNDRRLGNIASKLGLT